MTHFCWICTVRPRLGPWRDSECIIRVIIIDNLSFTYLNSLPFSAPVSDSVRDRLMPKRKKSFVCVQKTKTSFCPRCGKRFSSETRILQHMNQPSSACGTFLNDISGSPSRPTVQPSHSGLFLVSTFGTFRSRHSPTWAISRTSRLHADGLRWPRK